MSDRPPKRETHPTMPSANSHPLSERARAALARARSVYPSIPHDEDVPLAELSPAELGEMLLERRAVEDDCETMRACPACAGCRSCGGTHVGECPTCRSHHLPCDECLSCSFCGGAGMVPLRKYAEWTGPPPETPPFPPRDGG